MMAVIEAGQVRMTIDETHGARISSFMIGDLELTVTEADETIHWGVYPMAPWVGRLRDGRFSHKGQRVQMPLNMPPHSIHGTTYDRPWSQVNSTTFETDLGPDWPYPGKAVQRFGLNENGLDLTMEVHSDGPSFPAACGWHPWFLRQLARGGAAELSFDAKAMFRRNEDYLVDGVLVPPSDGPWDDCFLDLNGPVEILWSDALRLSFSSDTRHWVIYTMPEQAFCVEPQTGPPDALNIEPRLVTPGNPLIAHAKMRWELL